VPISVVVPAYNEEGSIAALCSLVSDFAQVCMDAVELVVVENGSQDATRLRLRDLQSKIHSFSLRLLELDLNVGYGGAIKRGIQISKYQEIMILPADGKYNLLALQACYQQYTTLASPTYMVKGRRISRNDPFSVRVLSFFYTCLTNILFRVFLKDANGLPKVFNKNLIIDHLGDLPSNACFDSGLIALWRRRSGRFYEVAVEFKQPSLTSTSWAGKRFKVSLSMFWEIVRFYHSAQKKDG
jgi:glycosyltransferase involved in cell wall biosynthesis